MQINENSISAATTETVFKWIEYAAANRGGTQKHDKKKNENLIEGKIYYEVVKSFQMSMCFQKIS